MQNQSQKRVLSPQNHGTPKKPRLDNGDSERMINKMPNSNSTTGNLKSILHGISYQEKILLLTLLGGTSSNNDTDFCMATEMTIAEKFDDLVYIQQDSNNPQGEIVFNFFQAKHNQDGSENLTYGKLISKEKKVGINCEGNDDFFHENGFDKYMLTPNAEIRKLLRRGSDVYILADEISKCINSKNKELKLDKLIFQIYHIELFTNKILAKVGNSIVFHEDFIGKKHNVNAESFYNVFSEIYKKQNLDKVKLTASEEFGKPFKKSSHLKQNECDNFAKELKKILEEKRKKNEAFITFEKSTKFLEEIAGRALFYSFSNQRVRFGMSFFKSKDKNMVMLRTSLEKTLENDDFLNLKYYEIKIPEYKSCFENIDFSEKKINTEIKAFFNSLVFLQTPNEIRLEEIIQFKLQTEFELMDIEFAQSYLKINIFDWMKEKGGSYIDKEKAIKTIDKCKLKFLISNFVGMSYVHHYIKLESYDVKFNENDKTYKGLLDFMDSEKKCVSLICEQHLFGALRLFQLVKFKKILRDTYLFITSSSALLQVDNFKKCFSLDSPIEYVIILCDDDEGHGDVQTLFNNLTGFVQNKHLLFIDKSFSLPGSIQDETTISSFSDETKEKFLEKEVQFQNQPVQLNLLVNEEIELIDDINVIIDLVLGNEIKIGTELEPCDAEKYYVEREVNHHVIFDEKIQKNTENDVFILEENLKNLDAKEKDKNIHIFNKINKLLQWKETKGMNYVLVDYNERQSLRCEKQNFLKTVLEKETLIISNAPGMGKSTFLSHLVSEIIKKDLKWIIKIDLFKNADKFCEEGVKMKEEYKKLLKLQYGCFKNLYKEMLKRRKVVIVFDGYDEVEPHDQLNALLKHLLEKNATILISTKTRCQKTLEKHFNLLSYSLIPISEIKELIQKYWESGSMLSTNTILHTNDVLKDFPCLKKNYVFTGTPRHIIMLAEMYQNNKPKGELYVLFDTIVTKTIEIYLRKRGNSTQWIMDQINKQQKREHRFFAIKMLIEKYKITADPFLEADKEEFTETKPRNLRSIGLVEEIDINATEISFVHQCIAEYFAAVYLARNLADKQKEILQTIDEIMKNSSEVFKECIFHLLLEKSKKQVNDERAKKSLKEYSQHNGLSNLEQYLESQNLDVMLPLID